MELSFDIKNQHITRTDHNRVVAGSQNYITAAFTFSEDWDGVAKTAIFNRCDGDAIKVVLVDNACAVPAEVLARQGGVSVSVYGGDLITVDECFFNVFPSGYVEAREAQDITPNLYNQIMAILSKLQGGATNRVLAKNSQADFDFKWIVGGGGGGGGADWGEIGGNIQDQTDLIEYVATVLLGYATQAWVEAKGYLTEHQSLTGYATEAWVEAKNYLTAAGLDDYATKVWVEAKGYLTEHQSLAGYATEAWVLGKSYITASALNGYATEAWVLAKNYITAAALTDYATQAWVEAKGYLTEHQSLAGYATENYVNSAVLPKSETITAQGATLTQEVKPNILCFINGSLTDLTITFANTSNYADEFNFVFKTSASGCNLSLPNTIIWDGGTAPTLEANKIYEVSVLAGTGVALISKGVSI